MRQKKGYSLIEVLVVVSILGVLFSLGLANYRDFSRRQVLVETAKTLEGNLRMAQALALEGRVPQESVCTSPQNLEGYYFNVLSSSRYEVRGHCSGGDASIAYVDVTLPSGIIINPSVPNPILFKVLGNGTNIGSGGTAIILSQVNGGLNQVSITNTGQIDLASISGSGPTSLPAATTPPVPTSIPSAVPSTTPSCVSLNFVSGSVSPSSVLSGGSYTYYCDYGAAVTNVSSAVPGSGTCTWSTWSGTTGVFNCVAGTSLGTFTNKCAIVSPNGGNYCVRQDTINSLNVVAPSPSPSAATWVTVDERSPSISYTGTWVNEDGIAQAYATTQKYTNTLNGSSSLTFVGRGVRVISKYNTNHGNVNIYVDGVLKTKVNTNGTPLFQQVIYENTTLTSGSHTVKFENASTNYSVMDAFSYLQ